MGSPNYNKTMQRQKRSEIAIFQKLTKKSILTTIEDFNKIKTVIEFHFRIRQVVPFFILFYFKARVDERFYGAHLSVILKLVSSAKKKKN